MTSRLENTFSNWAEDLDGPTTFQGQVVGNYELDELIGEGGMGLVFRARHQLLGRAAAIKRLLPELSDDPELVERFFREAVMTSRIKHSGIVEVYDYGSDDDGLAYLVMELLEGENLQSRLHREKTLSAKSALLIVRQLVSALEAAHREGIVHRDLKPSNIFFIPDEATTSGERVKVLDFGIAKTLSTDNDSLEITHTGAIVGTPLYMSPEQLSGEDLTGASDLYSVGCVLFRMLAGQPPIERDGHGAYLIAHATEPVPDLGAIIDCPDVVSSVVSTLLAKRPKDRPTPAQLRDRIDAILRGGGLDEPRAASVPTQEDNSALMASPRDLSRGDFTERPILQPRTPHNLAVAKPRSRKRRRLETIAISAVMAIAVGALFFLV